MNQVEPIENQLMLLNKKSNFSITTSNFQIQPTEIKYEYTFNFKEFFGLKQDQEANKAKRCVESFKSIKIYKGLWVPDESAITCYNCVKEFKLPFLRKHHCRICGNIFCQECSRKTVSGTYWGMNKQLRVCDFCYDMFQKLDNAVVETSENFYELGIPIKEQEMQSNLCNFYNLKRKSKHQKYCDISKIEDDKNFRLLQFDIKKEEENFKNFNSFSEFLIKSMIETILTQEKLYDKWYKVVCSLTKKVIMNVHPSFQDLNDSLDINEYVKIKTVKYKDQSLTRFIKGYALKKNVCSKRMRTEIENPRILLLDCGLEYFRPNKEIVNLTGKTEFQENAYFEILMKKIMMINPNVILINGGVSMKIQETLTQKISLVMNVKSETLKRIARFTKTYVLPSIDLIDSQMILGRCKKFKIEKVKHSIKQKKNQSNNLIADSYNLMIFEGCSPILGCTLIISGPDLSELKKLKQVIKIILLTAKDIFIQKQFLFLNLYKMPEFIVDENMLTVLKERLNTSYKNSFKLDKNSDDYQRNEFINGFDTSILTGKNLKFNLIKLTITSGSSNTVSERFSSSVGDKNSEKVTFLHTDPNENEVLKYINFVCTDPHELELKFYSNDLFCEKPFGKLLIDLYLERDLKCDVCRKNKSNHVYYLYQKKGRIKIQSILPGEEFSDTIIQHIEDNYDQFRDPTIGMCEDIYNSAIYYYGICKICKLIVTPLVKLSRAYFNMSFSKVLKHFFYNHNLYNRINFNHNLKYLGEHLVSNFCKHNIFKDITRIYISGTRLIKISYEENQLYFISNHFTKEKQSENKILMNLIDTQYTSLQKIAEYGLETMSAYFAGLESDIKDFYPLYLNDEVKIKIMNKVWGLINQEKDKIRELKHQLESIVIPKKESYFKANSFKKKFLSKIYQLKTAYFSIGKLFKKFKKAIWDPVKGSIIQENELTFKDDRDIKGIDNNQDLIELESDLNFFDEFHLKQSNDVNVDDLSSIICYSLISDQYKQLFSKNNKFNMLILKGELKTKENFFRSNSILKNNTNDQRLSLSRYNSSDSMIQLKFGIRQSISRNLSHIQFQENFIPKQKKVEKPTIYEEFTDTFLLFEPKKYTYFCKQLIDDHKINQLLETELLSDEKKHLTIILSNDYGFLEETNISIEIPSKLNITKRESLSEPQISKIDDRKITETGSEKEKIIENKSVSNSDHLKSFFEDIQTLKNEIELMSRSNVYSQKKTSKPTIEYKENSKRIEVCVYFPRQFEALRITYCTSHEDFTTSLIKGIIWAEVSGGKSKADFFKSIDNRYVIKSVNKLEFKMFIDAGFQYFHHLAKYLFHKMPSALAKILGAYKVKIKNLKSSKSESKYIFVMENLFFGLDPTKIHKSYDLKGSKSRRYISKKDQKIGQVLPDTNFKEDFKGEPIVLEKSVYDLLQSAIHNDSLVLSKMNVVDYSMLLIFENLGEPENQVLKKPIRIGVIDYVRKYTWDKQLEHVGKTIINRLQVPTIVNPINYKDRFKEAIRKYFIGLE